MGDLRRELRKLEDPRAWSKELGAVHRTLGKQAAEWARAEAIRNGGAQRHFAKAIRGYGSVQAARIGINNPNAFPTFWGAKQAWTGWNIQSEGRRPNQPEWVGSSWDVAVRGQGPYALNDAVADHLDDVQRIYAESIDDLMRRAFPD